MFDFRDAREKCGFSILEVADATHVSIRALYDIEKCIKRPCAKTIYKLAKQYNIPIGETLRAVRGTVPGTLKWYREIKGLSLVDVAKKLYVSDRTVCEWEKGTHKPSIDLSLLSNIYGVSVEDISFAIDFTQKNQE